jgi:hypothetical protein
LQAAVVAALQFWALVVQAAVVTVEAQLYKLLTQPQTQVQAVVVVQTKVHLLDITAELVAQDLLLFDT